PRRSHDHRREANSYTPSVHAEIWRATICRTTVFKSGNTQTFAVETSPVSLLPCPFVHGNALRTGNASLDGHLECGLG
ncbi:MAG: hypothetical protein EB058_12865, partial [Proteobacteria bacterium]|nr:hypothetical protein [Pseudomonadota bacterium]